MIPAPFLKTAGGKGKLLPKLRPRLPPPPWRRYREPFVGGGALFWDACPVDVPALLSDVREELILTYRAVRDQVGDVIALLRRHELAHRAAPSEHFYATRALRPELLNPIVAAARMIYLNRTCVNGLYRVNRAGEFNVSLGRYPNGVTICNEPLLRVCSARLQGVTIACGDFETMLGDLDAGEVIYLDPPYLPLNATSFVSYTADGFDGDDLAQEGLFDHLPDERKRLESSHKRLARMLHVIDRAGAFFLLSNADTPEARRLYEGWSITSIEAPRSISAKAKDRGPVAEILVTNRR